MKDKYGNELTIKEFFERWKKGMQAISPYQQTKVSLMGIILVLIGVIIGLYTTFKMRIWWLFTVLCGSFLLTSMNLLGTLQKYFSLKKINKIENEYKSTI